MYNPALFADLNPFVWDMGYEYFDFVDKYPCSFNCIRAHIFKIFHKAFERFTDLRERASIIKSIEGLKEIFEELKQVCSKDLEKYENSEKARDELPYFLCQAQIRHCKIENKEEINQQVEHVISQDASSAGIKRQLTEISTSLTEEGLDKGEEETTRNLIKVLERKRRKREKIERKENYQKLRKQKNLGEIDQEETVDKVKKPKYLNCERCKNPKSENCEHSLCRKCCKDKVFTEKVDCKGKTQI